MPIDSLGSFTGIEVSGDWTLGFFDRHDPDERDVLLSWSLFGLLEDSLFFNMLFKLCEHGHEIYESLGFFPRVNYRRSI